MWESIRAMWGKLPKKEKQRIRVDAERRHAGLDLASHNISSAAHDKVNRHLRKRPR